MRALLKLISKERQLETRYKARREKHISSLKATITRCDLLPRFFCIDARYCANLKAIRYESTSLNRIVADKSHRVIVA